MLNKLLAKTEKKIKGPNVGRDQSFLIGRLDYLFRKSKYQLKELLNQKHRQLQSNI